MAFNFLNILAVFYEYADPHTTPPARMFCINTSVFCINTF